MKTPGFTAETAISSCSRQYHMEAALRAPKSGVATVTPQQPVAPLPRPWMFCTPCFEAVGKRFCCDYYPRRGWHCYWLPC